MENIFVNGKGHIKITDFGLALDTAVSGVLYNKVCGTLTYMVPEVIEHCHEKDNWLGTIHRFSFYKTLYLKSTILYIKYDQPYFSSDTVEF